jgi:hypothetical protein
LVKTLLFKWLGFFDKKPKTDVGKRKFARVEISG